MQSSLVRTFASNDSDVNMKFFTSLRWPLLIWQIFGMAPFRIINKSLLPVKNTKLLFYACFIWLIHFSLLIFVIVCTSTYIDWSYETITGYDSFVAMLSVRLVACLIVAESVFKLNKQIEFLQKFFRVDAILRRNLKIDIDYRKEYFQNNILTILWILICFVTVIVVQVIFLQLDYKTPAVFWSMYFVSLIAYSIHYHRIVLYVNFILRRYKSINQFIEKVCLFEEKNANKFEVLLTRKKVPKVTFADYPIGQSITKSHLNDIRNAYQILYETTEMINDMFWWSLPLCIAIDFHRLVVNSYYFFIILLLKEDRLTLLIDIFWGSLNFWHLIFLAHACHSTSKEVIFGTIHRTV